MVVDNHFGKRIDGHEGMNSLVLFAKSCGLAIVNHKHFFIEKSL
jgi:hypothetical protein